MRDLEEATTAMIATSQPGEMPPITLVELERPAATPIELTFRPAVDPVAPVYVVIPAMGMRASFYAPLLDELAGAGVGAAVMELRGHQRRPAPPPSRRADHGYTDLAEDLGAAIAAIRRLRPGARVLALGHSLGGQVAVVQSALHPDRSDAAAPDALALVGSGSVAWRTWRGGSPYHLLRTQAAGALTRACGHFPGHRVGFAGREAPTQMTEWARWARTGRLTIGPARVDVERHLHEIRQPVLAISLAHDPLSPSTAVDALVRGLVNAPVTREHHALSVARPHFDWVRQPGALHDRLVGWATESARIPVA